MISKNAIVVAISGGSGSGKTTIAHQLRDHLQHSVKSVVLYQDNYYKDQKDVPFLKRANNNYDTPQAFDWPLMRRDLEALRNRKAIDTPIYDFTNHTRSAETHHIEPVDVVIFEGFMSLHENVLKYSDIRLFVDTPSDERLMRRMIRDLNERGRTFDSVAAQWRSTVRPMYRAHVAPQKESAHIIVPWYEISPVAIKAIKGSILDFVHAPAERPGTPPEVPSAVVATSIEGSVHAGEVHIGSPASPSEKTPANVRQQQPQATRTNQPQRQNPPRQPQASNPHGQQPPPKANAPVQRTPSVAGQQTPGRPNNQRQNQQQAQRPRQNQPQHRPQQQPAAGQPAAHQKPPPSQSGSQRSQHQQQQSRPQPASVDRTKSGPKTEKPD